MKALLSFVTVCQEATCFLADFDAPARRACSLRSRKPAEAGWRDSGQAGLALSGGPVLAGPNPALRDRRASRACGIHAS
jgi:hypothetical protein